MVELAQRLHQVRGSITSECEKLGRPEPTLIVVTKNHSVELAAELLKLGETEFGENRVQEALAKSQELELAVPGNSVNWNLIGQLQTNKVKQALQFAASIHSLDRISLLDELAKRTLERSVPLDVFVQLNLTDDEGRGGVPKHELLSFAAKVMEVSTLRLRGVMAVATLEAEPERDFEVVAKLSAALRREIPQADQLSIGMSGDYLVALSYGATHLRIGTAITGNRTY
jgi:pyridoxal phosphate enzyme (YggS family)